MHRPERSIPAPAGFMRKDVGKERFTGSALRSECGKAPQNRHAPGATGEAEPKSTAIARRRTASPNPRSAASHFTRGETHRRLGRYHAAILEYRKAVELAPEVPYYRYKLGDCYAVAGLGGNALKELEAARDLAPTDGFYHFWLGDVYARMGRPQDAIQAMQQATALRAR